MDPYIDHGSGNRNHKYQQSPAFGNQRYGPQYAQQQAQHYQKGPTNQKPNGRKHAYSVDQQATNRNRNRNRNRNNNNSNNNSHSNNGYRQQYNYNNVPNQYAQFQQYQQQQQQQQLQQHNKYIHQQHHQQKHHHKQRRNKQRKANSPTPDDMNEIHFFSDNNNNQNQNRNRNRNHNGDHDNRIKKSHKYSVPNVQKQTQIRKIHHSSTPNAAGDNNRRDRDRRRRDKRDRRRDKRRSPSPNPNHQQYTGYVSPSPSPQPPTTTSTSNDNNNNNNNKMRRHTATTTHTHKQRKKRSSKSPMRSNGSTQISSSNNNNNSNHAKLNKGKLAEKFTIREKLGRGNFSVVRRVIRKEDDKEFAAKIISTKTMSQQEIKDTHDEVDILAKLHHPNIVTLIDYIFTPRHLYIVLELLSGGELFERLQKQKKFNEGMAAGITKQIADALSYMHSKGVVHRDLKPENILYEDMNDSAKIKISDFGLSRDLKSTVSRPLKTSCGTPGYVAPEIIRQQIYDESVDLWAAGVIIYILLCGFPPFQGAGVEPQQSMFRKIKSGKYSYPKPAWSKISACAMDCIDSLLCVNPKDRMTAKELLAHPWIKQAEIKNQHSFLDIHFQSNLSNYLHKKRFRRGVRLIITLNRMVRGAGLEKIAREQRKQFRIRLKQYKKQLKEQQRKIYQKQQQLKLMNVHSDEYDDEYMGYTIIDPDSTPNIDYSKV